MSEFNNYVNSPVAVYKDELYKLPLNMNTFSKMWGIKTPQEAKEIIEKQRREAGIAEPKNLEEQALFLGGRDIYEKLIKGYTEKQWGRRCTELPAFIIQRRPFRFTYDNNTYQIGEKQIPWKVREVNVMLLYGCDYGTYNPCVFLEAYFFRGVLYIENEYMYDGRRSMRQKTDLEYTRDFQIFRKDHYRAIVVDPSASSFITSLVKNGEKVMKAKNEVYSGIQKTYRMLNEGAIKINKDKCPGLIKEIGMYIWNQKRADTLGKEDPVKANDHFCDALRYIVSTIVPDYQSFGEINRM